MNTSWGSLAWNLLRATYVVLWTKYTNAGRAWKSARTEHEEKKERNCELRARKNWLDVDDLRLERNHLPGSVLVYIRKDELRMRLGFDEYYYRRHEANMWHDVRVQWTAQWSRYQHEQLQDQMEEIKDANEDN